MWNDLTCFMVTFRRRNFILEVNYSQFKFLLNSMKVLRKIIQYIIDRKCNIDKIEKLPCFNQTSVEWKFFFFLTIGKGKYTTLYCCIRQNFYTYSYSSIYPYDYNVHFHAIWNINKCEFSRIFGDYRFFSFFFNLYSLRISPDLGTCLVEFHILMLNFSSDTI